MNAAKTRRVQADRFGNIPHAVAMSVNKSFSGQRHVAEGPITESRASFQGLVVGALWQVEVRSIGDLPP